MQLQYLFRPKNPMLHHCSESFYQAMTLNHNTDIVDSPDYITSVTVENSLDLVKKLLNLNSEDSISLFFFLIQSDYLVLTLILKIVANTFSKKLKVYYMMHEPKFEKGRINAFKAWLTFIYHFLFGHLADKILLPSEQALFKAKEFIQAHKLEKINLTFVSQSESLLHNNLAQLKSTWDNSKTFSLLGRADVDKNPQGFLSLATTINQHYPGKARFIRGGRDRNVNLAYDEDLIIRFPSFISSNAKQFLFGLTHFVVIPYFLSTQSGVIVEALSYGKVLIVNDIPTFSYLKGLKFAFVIDFNDETAIVNCIHDLFSMNINDYETRSWEAVSYFQENHSETYLSKIISNIR